MCDRDPRFTASFFQEVFDQLGTKLALSTANHPQTDGSVERINRLVGDILRAFVNHKQDNWDTVLPLCEFANNSSQQASTGNTPFFLRLHPRAPVDLVARGGIQSTSVGWLQAQQDAITVAQDAMVAAQARQGFYTDQGRAPASLVVGDQVMVFRYILLTPEARNQPSRKLRPKWFGRFKVIERIVSNAYCLELPHTIRCHPEFNVSALRHYVENTIPRRRLPTPPPVTDLDGHSRYVVDKILDHRTRHRRLQYLVKRAGYADATWEPALTAWWMSQARTLYNLGSTN